MLYSKQFPERKEAHARRHYKGIAFDTTACTTFLSRLLQDENSVFEIKIVLPQPNLHVSAQRLMQYAVVVDIP